MNMKKYVIALSMLTLVSSCDFLDYRATSGRTEEEVYGYYENFRGLVSDVYSYLPVDFGRIGDAMMESATDNSVYTWESNSIYYIVNGVWSPLMRVDDGWGFWDGIRSANSFLENFDPSALDKFQYNANYDEMLAKSKMFPYEVRFLRAFLLFELAKRYGDIPLITKTCDTEEINAIKKTAFDEVIDFIVAECDAAAEVLPENYKDYWGDTGRVTKGTALALKSRALLYAASPLHNPTNDATKWEKAAKAAHEVMAMGIYELSAIASDPLYSTKGGNEVLKSKQLIFERRNASKTNDFEARNEPMGYDGAEGGNTPSQNLVDAYEMLNGEAFDWKNPEHVKHIYYDEKGKPTRDPRLYLNVLTNGSTWLNQKVETFEGGKHNVLDGSTLTGYYLRKYMNPSVSLDPVKPNKIEHHYILFRYAEVLLNYAEAMNEWLGPNGTADECQESAATVLTQIRRAAGMPAVVESDPDLFRNKVRNERRIELAFEGHRFYDIRRWKIAGEEGVRNVYGVKIIKEADGTFSYERELIHTLAWDANDKMNLFPFPQNEVYINPDGLTQNPGW